MKLTKPEKEDAIRFLSEITWKIDYSGTNRQTLKSVTNSVLLKWARMSMLP